MAGNVVVAQRGSQRWCGGGFGLKPERKSKAMVGLLWLFLVTGEEEEERSWWEGAVAASLGFGRAPFFLKCIFLYFFVGFLVMAFS